MVLGNVALPFAFHQIPNGGRMFLPIFFFTLIAGWRFGLTAGLFTALLSPLANHVLTGMPTTAMLPVLILQSALLGTLAAVVASRGRKTTLALLALVVVLHQTLVLLPVLLASGPLACLTALQVRAPGLMLQLVGGFLVLALLMRFLPPGRTAADAA
jgi:thiamine transporter ThiT